MKNEIIYKTSDDLLWENIRKEITTMFSGFNISKKGCAYTIEWIDGPEIFDVYDIIENGKEHMLRTI